MRITSYNRAQLGELIASDHFRSLDIIPITTHRAVSQINNPDCSDDDILLWVAEENNALIGYAGVLPDVCSVGGVREKIYWLSCFWVDKQHRNGSLASAVFFPLVKQYRERLFISSFVPSLEKTYQRLGIFHQTSFGTGTRFYLNFCSAVILPDRIPRGVWLKPILRLIDRTLNIGLSVRKMFFKKLSEGFNVIENDDFNDEFQSLLDHERRSETYMNRGADHFRWILEYPWVIEGAQDSESRRYFFSSTSKRFEYCSLKHYHENRLTGFALLKTRDTSMTVSYLYANDDAIDGIAGYVLHKASGENLDMITTFDDRLARSIRKHRGRYLFSKRIRRPYLITKNMDVPVSSFQEGDGDAVFT